MQWNLIRLRKEAGLTQKQVAEEVNMSFYAYRNKEAGLTPFKDYEMIAIRKFFKKSMDEIFLPTNCNIHAISENKEEQNAKT